MNLRRLNSVAIWMVISLWLGGNVEAQLATFSPTDDAKLHGAIIDGLSGRPVRGAAVRILSEPELTLFTTDDVVTLSNKTQLFVGNPVAFTNERGTLSMDSPLDFPSLYLAGAMIDDDGYLVAAAPGAQPLASPVGFAYMQIEITSRMFLVRGKTHAGYLPALAVPPKSDEQAGAMLVPLLNELTVEVIPPVVVRGGNVELNVKWRYVAMPLMESQVAYSDEKDAKTQVVELVKRFGDAGRVTEQWKVNAHPVGDQTGMQEVGIVAHLDAPHNTAPAARAAAYYYVAATQDEANTYQQVLAAKQLSSEMSAQAIRICREAIREFPKMDIAWVELVRRLAANKSWVDVREVTEAAPVTAKNTFVVASAAAAAYEQIGVKDKRWGSLIAIAASTDAPSTARELCFAEALKAGQYGVAKQIALHLGRGKRASAQRYLAWKSGERDVPNEERVWMAEALVANGEPDEALVVLADVDLDALDEYRREKYFTFLAAFYLDKGDVVRGAEALAQLAKLKKKPVEELEDHLLLGKLAEAKGDLTSALHHYAQGIGTIDAHVEAFERTLLKSLQEESRTDAAQYASAALSLLAAHRFEKATELARGAIERDPKLPAAHLSLALAAQMTGKVREAVSSLKQAHGLAPQNQYLAIEYERARDLANMNKAHSSVFRVWTDNRGRIAEAALLNVRNGQVVLHARGGREFTVPIEKLSEEDQKYLGQNNSQ